MEVAGLIFSNIHDSSISELTNIRTMASVPFGCRYRLIDFALSNMVNSGITKIGIITHNNYQSLMDHLGTGKTGILPDDRAVSKSFLRSLIHTTTPTVVVCIALVWKH